MAPATEVIWRAMRRSVRDGAPGLRIPPLLLDSPPGIGKSYWSRRLGALLATSTTVIEATGENASFGIVGSQRGWGGSHPGRLIETVLQSRIANPVMVVDEVEKAGRATSTNGHAFGLAEALPPLLEPLTAQRWSCPYYQVKFDMSWVIWVLTSNDFRLLPEPLLSRCPPIRLCHLTLAELLAFVRREGAKRALSEASGGDLRDPLPSLPATASPQPADRLPHAATCRRSRTGADAPLSRPIRFSYLPESNTPAASPQPPPSCHRNGETIMKLSPQDRAWFDKVLSAIAAAEAGPSGADLAQAPVLSDWKAAISPDGHIMLWGKVTDHPLLGNASIHTSQLIAIDPEAGWARTASRWYRLGRSIDALEAELADSMNGKAKLAGSFQFALPGFANINDPELLQKLLATYIARVRGIDAADRSASGKEE